MNPLGPFAMCAAFPRPDYYGPSAPPRGRQQTTCLPARPAWQAGTGRGPQAVPTFTMSRSTG